MNLYVHSAYFFHPQVLRLEGCRQRNFLYQANGSPDCVVGKAAGCVKIKNANQHQGEQ